MRNVTVKGTGMSGVTVKGTGMSGVTLSKVRVMRSVTVNVTGHEEYDCKRCGS